MWSTPKEALTIFRPQLGGKRVYTMPTSQAVAQQARDREERLEARYNLRIEGAGDNPITAYRRFRSWKQLSPVFQSPFMQLPKQSWRILERR